MWVGTRIGPEWLKSGDDLRFLKQVGVDYLSVSLHALKGYAETGRFEKDDLSRLVDRLDSFGLKIGRASSYGPPVDDIHLGRPNSQRRTDDLCQALETLGQVGIGVFCIRCLWAETLLKQERPGWSNKYGRGGYEYPAFSLGALESARCEPELRVTAGQLWDNLIELHRQVVPVAEQAGVKLAMHGNDHPPLYWAYGNPQVLCQYADFDRLFAAVPSPNNGMTFCIGTRYETGEDVFEGIERYGLLGKIFYVDFRNVRGTLPKTRGYEEVYPDDGDLDMGGVVRALDQAGYQGVLDIDHIRQMSGDTPLGHRFVAYAAGYIKGLLAGLPRSG
ncbi:MAG: mannonate dehydratase [Chloroflexi bacterium]|nr:mannonate dehydratase [Chloroflexota bacterium]